MDAQIEQFTERKLHYHLISPIHVLRFKSLKTLSLRNTAEGITMFTISIGTTLTGTEITLNPYAQSMEEIAPVFKSFSELDLFDALMAMEYMTLIAIRSSDIEHEWIPALTEHSVYLRKQLTEAIILEYRTALLLSDAFKARDYGEQRVHEKYRIDKQH